MGWQPPAYHLFVVAAKHLKLSPARRESEIMRDHWVNVRFTGQELIVLEQKCGVVRMSRSEYIRVLLDSKPLPKPGNFQAIQDLLTINRDLARLGNLMKLCITEIANTSIPERNVHVEELNTLKNEIRTRQAELKALVKQIKP